MYLYIYYNQTHPARNVFAYLFSGNITKYKVLKDTYKPILNICNKWKSINYKVLLHYLNKTKKKDSKELEKIIKKCYPEVKVIFYYPHNKWNVDFTRTLANTSFKKIIFIDDMHTKTKSKANFNLCNKFDKILTTYAYKAPRLRPELDLEKVTSFPHYFPDHMLFKKRKKTINKVLVSGICTGCDWNCDKWRRLSYNVRYNIFDKYKYYNWLDTLCIHRNITGINFYHYISSYRIAIATPGDIGYIVCKYFEIPACNTLLLAYNKNIEDDLENMGFIDGENYIGFNLENFEDKVNDIINKKININEIITNGNKLIRDRHLLSNRIIQLDEICKSILD